MEPPASRRVADAGVAMIFEKTFTSIANHVARAAGLPTTFMICCVVVLIWAVTGPLFNFSDTWQLVINTGTTIVTFLMVFLIQNTQNRDGAAVQAKLDELIRVSKAHNTFIGIEHLTETEVEEFRKKCEAAARESGAEAEEAEEAAEEAEEAADEAKDAARETKRAAPKSRRSPARATARS
jgi:low affinity Fe/Cu permease